MAFLSYVVIVVGLVLLAHAGYSAQEHAALSSTTAQHHTHAATNSLPLDIRIETIVATLTVVLGLVMGSPKLRPIRWNIWAGKIEREGGAGFTDGTGRTEKDFRGNPFAALDARQGFVDIRKQRKEFAQWAKGEKQ